MGFARVLVAALWLRTASAIFGEDEDPGCKWFCANWCDPDKLDYCHQKPCNPDDERDCPTSYCEIELACRKSSSEKVNDGDQKLLLFAVSAACVVAICISAACCYQCAQLDDEDASGNARGVGTSRAAAELDGMEQRAAVQIQRATRSHLQGQRGASAGARGPPPKPRRTSTQVSPRWMAMRAPGGPLAFPKQSAAADMV